MSDIDRKIDDFLSRLEVPEPNPEVVAFAKEKARLALKHRHSIKEARSSWWAGPIWRYSSVFAACAVIFIMFYPQPQQPIGFDTPWERVVSEQQAMYREMHQVFPGQFQGVIASENDSEVVLGGYAPVKDQAIILELKHGEQVIQALTFSGQTVQLGLAGQSFEFEVIALDEGRLAIISETDGPVELDVRKVGYQVYKPRKGFSLRAGFLQSAPKPRTKPKAKKVAL